MAVAAVPPLLNKIPDTTVHLVLGVPVEELLEEELLEEVLAAAAAASFYALVTTTVVEVFTTAVATFEAESHLVVGLSRRQVPVQTAVSAKTRFCSIAGLAVNLLFQEAVSVATGRAAARTDLVA